MALVYGNGKILKVDLTNAKTWVDTPPDSFYRMYGGGRAMGMYYVLENVPPGVPRKPTQRTPRSHDAPSFLVWVGSSMDRKKRMMCSTQLPGGI